MPRQAHFSEAACTSTVHVTVAAALIRGGVKGRRTSEARHHAPMPASYKRYMTILNGKEETSGLPSACPGAVDA